ncbi:transposase [Komagataeibacter melomenusus]
MMQSVFSDTAWSVWEPLIEEARPKGKTPPQNLRRTVPAICWCHQNGAKWHALSSRQGRMTQKFSMPLSWVKCLL